MKSVRLLVVLMAVCFFSTSVFAGVFKCKDEYGKTAYQSAPCAEENEAHEIDVKTGGITNLAIEKGKRAAALELIKQQQAEKQKMLVLMATRKKEAAEQSALNQQLIKNNPKQYSAFAIPPYKIDKLSTLVERYKDRLPEIEKFRRLAAQKALATGECNRVEVDELSVNSKPGELVFSIDCSTAKNFKFNEAELLK